MQRLRQQLTGRLSLRSYLPCFPQPFRNPVPGEQLSVVGLKLLPAQLNVRLIVNLAARTSAQPAR